MEEDGPLMVFLGGRGSCHTGAAFGEDLWAAGVGGIQEYSVPLGEVSGKGSLGHFSTAIPDLRNIAQMFLFTSYSCLLRIKIADST